MYYQRSTLLTLIFALVLLISACDEDSNNKASGDFRVTIENVGESYPVTNSGNFTTPVGASQPAPIFPGDAYEVEFKAPKGSHLSFVTMFVQSNDWFFATGSTGLALYDGSGNQITGDVTSELNLYDAGTEMDQEAGVGDNQAPRQSGADTGPMDSNSNVRMVSESGLPADNEVIKATLTSTGDNTFMLRIENVSTSSTLQTSEGTKPVPLSPGIFAIHSPDQSNLLFEAGMPDYDEGLEAIAEDGDPSTLTMSLQNKTGITALLSPGAYAVHSADENPLFTNGQPAMDNGLEEVAEDGAPSMLATALGSMDNVSSAGAFNTPGGSSSAGPLLPGNSYSFTFTAEEGEYLTLATMYVQSNDLFYAPDQMGVALFDEEGMPVTGEITSSMMLWDAGTEMNEMPGFGHNQAPRQSGADTGPMDSNSNVRPVNDSYTYSDILQVTVEIAE